MTTRGKKAAGFGSVDGELSPLDDLQVPATDRGLLLGDAVFETLRTYDGRLFALQDHLDRLERSLRGIGMSSLPPRERVARWGREAVAATLDEVQQAGLTTTDDPPACVLRLTVTRGSGPPGLSAKGAGPPRVIVIGRFLPPPAPEVYERGLRVVTARVKRSPVAVQDPTIKATSALNLIMARMEADQAGADEALLTDAEGRYLEASTANLFVVRGSEYWTPRGADGVLEGVTAGVVQELLQEQGFRGHLGPISRSVLLEAEEVFLTQTTREVLPVVQVDDRAVGGGTPGPVARDLRGRFLERVPERLDSPPG